MNEHQRDMLIEHMDGRRHRQVRKAGSRYRTMEALLNRALLAVDGRTDPPLTYITERGRHALAAALADWIEAEEKTYAAIIESMAARPDQPRKTAAEAHRKDPEGELFALLRQHRRRTQAEHWAEESSL